MKSAKGSKNLNGRENGRSGGRSEQGNGNPNPSLSCNRDAGSCERENNANSRQVDQNLQNTQRRFKFV